MPKLCEMVSKVARDAQLVFFCVSSALVSEVLLMHHVFNGQWMILMWTIAEMIFKMERRQLHFFLPPQLSNFDRWEDKKDDDENDED